MESDDDFLSATQFRQYRGSNQAVTSTSRPLARDRLGPNQPSQSNQSRGQSSQSDELSQIQDGLKFLMERVAQLSGDSTGIKRPGEQKPFEKRSDTKEQCQLCKKFYANKTTLFRHYRAMHQEMNPEKYHGCSVNSTVVSLDVSFRENTCGVCGYVAASQNALDAHNRDVHSNVMNVNSNNANTRTVHSIASNSSNDALNRADVVASASNKENMSNNANINKLHKCEECACYFEERNKLDEHMKVQHGFEVVCKICNKNFLFKDIDGHVKEVHPDVYRKNKEKNEKVIIEKMMKNRKGNRVRVFICTKCDIKIVDKIEADKHARGHKKGLKIKVAPRTKVANNEKNFTDAISNNHVILTCDDCDVSTDSYDVAVEHSQDHITNNLNDIVTQQCLICELKFEPLCYKKHIDLHYKDKEIHKESFRYFKYRHQVLLSENWFYCFSTAIPELKKMIDESIYEYTRSVKMRVTHGGTDNLYKCCQCDHFVEPAAVLNHTLNYDTCVKVKCSYTCDICERKFNNRLARNNHAKDHKTEETYKTVLFNHDNDKEFNKILNDANIRFNSDGQNSEQVIDNAHVNAPKVLYKCLCGLCFVTNENADVHKKICPGKDKKKSCPKCNNLFSPEELLTHCFEHHSNQTQIVIENISPDVIVIESDEESDNSGNNDDIIEINSSDEDGAQTERFDNIKIEVLVHGDAETVRGSNEDAEKQNMNASDAAITEVVENVEQVASEANLLIEKSEKDIDEDEDRCDNGIEGTDEMTDEDSQNTIIPENTETATAVANPAMNKHDKVKCVPTNLLLNPLHFEMNGESIDRVLNAEITAGIESVRQQLKMTNALGSVLFDVTIKRENSWFDPTDFSNIRGRRSLRQAEIQPLTNLSQEIVDLLLTDDEETEISQDADETEINDNIRSDENNDTLNEGTEKNDMCEDTSMIISNTLTEQIQNEDTVVDMNYISRTSNNEDNTAIIQNEVNNIEESTGEINPDFETQPAFTNINVQEVSNYSPHSPHEEDKNNANDQDYSDDEDDLFLPSGFENREKARNTEFNEKEMSQETPFNCPEDQVVAMVASAKNITQSSNTIEESGSIRFEIPRNNTSTCVEHPQNDTEINDIRSDENNDILNRESNETEIDKEVNRSSENNGILNTNPLGIDNENAPTEHVQINHDEDTQHFVEPTPNETSIIINNITQPEVILREVISEQQTEGNIKKEFGYMNINIKRELLEENVQETGAGCDKEVRIKTEPMKYNEDKENDIFVVKNADNDNYNNCSIC